MEAHLGSHPGGGGGIVYNHIFLMMLIVNIDIIHKFISNSLANKTQYASALPQQTNLAIARPSLLV